MNRSKSMWMAQAACLLIAMSSAAMSAEKASDIRKQMSKLEDEYFALYNKLNTDRQYDMVCRKEAQTGSTFLKRVCKPRYVEAVQRDHAAERVQAAARGGPGIDATNPGTAPSFWQDDGFRKNMLEVMRKSPKLQALGEKRDALQVRLDALAKK